MPVSLFDVRPLEEHDRFAGVGWQHPHANGICTSPLQSVHHVKLYNAGNFFDAQAIPPADVPAIGKQLAGMKTVIIECHPRLVDQRCLRFRDQLGGELEVAMGLETIHPEVLPRLNKRMTLDDYHRAAGFLHKHGIFIRAFILLRPPYLAEAEGVEWACRSLEFAFDNGVKCCVVIPTRSGNGASISCNSKAISLRRHSLRWKGCWNGVSIDRKVEFSSICGTSTSSSNVPCAAPRALIGSSG